MRRTRAGGSPMQTAISARQGIDVGVFAGGPNLSSVEAIVAAGRADVGIDQLERIVDANARRHRLRDLRRALSDRIRRRCSRCRRIRCAPRAISSANASDCSRVRRCISMRCWPSIICRRSYTEVVVGSTRRSAARRAPAMPICASSPNQPLQLSQRGIPAVTATFDQLGYATYTDCLFCTRDFLKGNRADARATTCARCNAAGRKRRAIPRSPRAHLAVTLRYRARTRRTARNSPRPARKSRCSRAPIRARTAYSGSIKRVAGPVYTTLRATRRTRPYPASRTS